MLNRRSEGENAQSGRLSFTQPISDRVVGNDDVEVAVRVDDADRDILAGVGVCTHVAARETARAVNLSPCWPTYASTIISSASAPLASPLFADLTGLPPLLLQVGTAEVLLDDSARLAVRLPDGLGSGRESNSTTIGREVGSERFSGSACTATAARHDAMTAQEKRHADSGDRTSLTLGPCRAGSPRINRFRSRDP